jgi:coenzyme F420-dependent glucose-6-phosphate dehydrogenase
MEFGYAISSEEHVPAKLVANARRAEAAGFSFALISDHFHPWIDQQGQSPFVWGVIGAISQVPEKLRLGTGVTCPILRIHPAILAQAAATAASLMPGRFFLGLGTGENLNEHITGEHWPPIETRQLMLREAVDVIRLLWQGESTTHYGDYFTVENARIYTLPDELPPIYVAAGGPNSGELAGEIGDGLISTSPDKEVAQKFKAGGGSRKPRYGQITLCWAKTKAEAKRTAYKWWPTASILGELHQELPLPAHFEQAAEMVSEDDVAETIICGPDADGLLKSVKEYVDAGFDHIYFHQVGPDQEGFFHYYEQELAPRLNRVASRDGARAHR